ncbi:hypothetical protein BJX64DRAFT_288530 [Aspergillus heterothallicus]
MEVADFDSSLPLPRSTAQKQNQYLFTNGSDGYPPHLNLVGKGDEKDPEQRTDLPLDKIFDNMRMTQSGALMRDFLSWWRKVVAKGIADWNLGDMGTPDRGKTLKEVEDYNRRCRNSKDEKNDSFDQPNVGDLEDWFSDAWFSQQQFTGVNPTIIEMASDFWIDYFMASSKVSEAAAVTDTLKYMKDNCRQSLYMQDYSYFRAAAGVKPANRNIETYSEEHHWLRKREVLYLSTRDGASVKLD